MFIKEDLKQMFALLAARGGCWLTAGEPRAGAPPRAPTARGWEGGPGGVDGEREVGEHGHHRSWPGSPFPLLLPGPGGEGVPASGHQTSANEMI